MKLCSIWTVICTVLSLASASGSVSSDEKIYCSSWGWLHNSSKPSAAVIFYHMRKVGGTAILNLVHRWLIHHKCIPHDESSHKIFLGSYEGYRPMSTSSNSVCRNFEFRHIERYCLQAQQLLKVFPQKLNRTSARLSFFTVLRDPIERIGSQAFYGPLHLAFGRFEIDKSIQEICYPSSMKDKYCVKYATRLAEERISSNASLWFKWINEKNASTSLDMYNKNYYVHRMAGGVDVRHYARLKSSTACLKNPSSCPDGHFPMNLVTPQNGKESIHSLLCNITSRTTCSRFRPQMLSDAAFTEFRLLAQQALIAHFSFLILEDMGSEKSIRILKHVLNEPSADLMQTLINHGNSGLLVRARDKQDRLPKLSYRSLMPPEVVEFLVQDNKEDIEFYNFAKRLYNQDWWLNLHT